MGAVPAGAGAVDGAGLAGGGLGGIGVVAAAGRTGMYSGPFWPQPARRLHSTATLKARRAAAGTRRAGSKEGFTFRITV